MNTPMESNSQESKGARVTCKSCFLVFESGNPPYCVNGGLCTQAVSAGEVTVAEPCEGKTGITTCKHCDTYIGELPSGVWVHVAEYGIAGQRECRSRLPSPQVEAGAQGDRSEGELKCQHCRNKAPRVHKDSSAPERWYHLYGAYHQNEVPCEDQSYDGHSAPAPAAAIELPELSAEAWQDLQDGYAQGSLNERTDQLRAALQEAASARAERARKRMCFCGTSRPADTNTGFGYMCDMHAQEINGVYARLESSEQANETLRGAVLELIAKWLRDAEKENALPMATQVDVFGKEDLIYAHMRELNAALGEQGGANAADVPPQEWKPRKGDEVEWKGAGLGKRILRRGVVVRVWEKNCEVRVERGKMMKPFTSWLKLADGSVRRG